MRSIQKGKKQPVEIVRKRIETRRQKNNGEYCSEETKRKLREANEGKKHTEESKQKMSVAHEGKKHTEETLQKMSAAMQGKNKDRKKPPRSVEHCKKISENRIKRIQQNGGNYGIKGEFYSTKNQKEIRYDSLYELQAYQILEQDNEVRSYDRCRFSIDYVFNNGVHRYLPDVYVVYVDNTEEILEIKPEYLLEAEINKIKFISAREYCNKNRMKYNVWTEKELFKKEV